MTASVPEPAAPVTPGRAAWQAYEARHAALDELDEAHGFAPADDWYWQQATDDERSAWEAAAQAVLNQAFPGLRKQLGEARAELGQLRELVAEILAERPAVTNDERQQDAEWRQRAGLDG